MTHGVDWPGKEASGGASFYCLSHWASAQLTMPEWIMTAHG